MPSANQYLTLPPPWRGLCNKGPRHERPIDTVSSSLNWMCGPGTDYEFTTRWGTEIWLPPPTRPLNYIGDFSDQNSDGFAANYCVTYQSGGVPGAVMIWGGAAWVALAGPGIANVTALVRTHITFDLAGTDYVLYCDGVGQPIKISPVAATYAAFASAPEIYKASMVVADRLVVGNLATSGAEWVDCSSAINFEAGWNINMVKLADTTGPIVAMRSMGATMGVIYKSDAIYLCIPQTGPAPFRYELRASGIIGPVNEQAVVVLPDNTHIWVGRDGQVYRFDGSSVTAALPLCDSPLINVPPSALARVQGIYWKSRQEAYFFFPVGSFPGIADFYTDGGALLVNYPDMTAFMLGWPYHFVQMVIPPWGCYWSFDPGLVGFGWYWMGGGGYTPRPRLMFSGGALHIEDPPSITNYILAAQTGWPRGLGSSADGVLTLQWANKTNATGCVNYLYYQESILAQGALVTPLESEWMIRRAYNCGPAGSTEFVTPSLGARRYGTNQIITGDPFDAAVYEKHAQGFSTISTPYSSSPISIDGSAHSLGLTGNHDNVFSLPGDAGGNYGRLELSGARLAFYGSTPGRR